MLTVPSVCLLTAFEQEENLFTPAEQQQISIETPGLFSHSDAFQIEMGLLKPTEYSFPLPVGKATLSNNILEISTSKGDAVKAMFDGTVRLSRKHPEQGHVIVVRHHNGLETVYANNAQNLVKVGDKVKAGQTLAIVGERSGKAVCLFSIMVNGARINPETVIDIHSQRLRKQTLLCKRKGALVDISSVGKATSAGEEVDYDKDPFERTDELRIDLEAMAPGSWAYPLAGSKVISPYGGKRRHSGVDLKTKPNDDIVAAFPGKVVRSGPFSGYGNCIVIKHAYGLQTLYSHQSKNLVKTGDVVKAGQVIGLTGRTGRATTEHLHLEVQFKGKRVNPSMVFDYANHSLQPSTLILKKNGSITSRRNTR